ncbi:transcription initiation factor TFIID subunit 2 [Impatiens glandulifera]|uniref:transcription initiation factor TFIID subunit 2 n=1 Tax=Impatiens glandulifera TaxID=253017 RepID=UPI001FB05C1E|nr:transcription initiation factor TFIID subunit 2 [Impatiens glandulifera]
MAKPRNKPKTEDQKSDNTDGVLQHQKLCLSIDMEKRLIYGYTELQIAVPDNGIVGLHADNLVIDNVLVDGEPAKFEVFPHYQHLENENRWCSVSSASSAADAAGSVYLSALEREMVPNLLIMCPKNEKSSSEEQGQQQSENGLQPLNEPKQNVKRVHIDYWVEMAETGIHFEDNVLHTDNQLRRACCWFPCMDDNMQRCCYDLEFTVASNLVAISTGNLLCQVLSKDDPPRKTFVYKLNLPVTARWISLTVAPFAILPDRQSGLLTYFCMPDNLSKLQNTVAFFHSAFSHYEDYLTASFPFGSYSQVFIPPEMAISSMSLGASMTIFSSHLLFDDKIIDQIIETRIKLAYALARQWFGVYITAESSSDEWLLDGLAGFLTDSFVKQFLGNNEARFRRYKENSAVCKADDSGATTLSSSAASEDLHGTQSIGFYGKIRSWKSVAVLQMLEKQMGPESFRKILQIIVLRAQETARSLRTLSTKEFRQFANKIGNLERPFLKEFFPRWVGYCGCPEMRMGFSYNKRKNMIELAVLRGCTVPPDAYAKILNHNPDSESRDSSVGWPGMMSIRVHELDGMYDHPILPMAGEAWQLMEIQCHSKVAAKRFQKPKKSSKPDGSDDNGDVVLDTRSNVDSPLLWLRADPEMEYLAEIHFNQPVPMWINQLEKDKDVVAQAQAITVLEALPQLSFSVVNALNSFLNDSKAYWRVRIEAAYALANTATEDTDWAGLLHLIKFYKSRRFDADVGFPKPNDFRDFAEHFVLEAIPNAVAMVRSADKKSPRQAVEFIVQLLKYNDNNGNPYSDVFWLASLVQSIGELEFGQQSVSFLSSLLKRIDRLFQFDRLIPSHNGILTTNCIRTLTQVGLKLSAYIDINNVVELIKPFQDLKTMWFIRIEANKALLDLQFHSKGIDAALKLFMKYLEEEPSLRGQKKLSVHMTRICQIRGGGSDPIDDVESGTLGALLRLIESRVAFNNVFLRHYIFCILQILAGRQPTLFGISRDGIKSYAETCSELKKLFAACIEETKTMGGTDMDVPIHLDQEQMFNMEIFSNPDLLTNNNEPPPVPVDFSDFPISNDNLSVPPPSPPVIFSSDFPISNDNLSLPPPPDPVPVPNLPIVEHNSVEVEVKTETDITVSNSQERRKPVLKFRVKRSNKAEEGGDTATTVVEKADRGGGGGASSSVSVDAPPHNVVEEVNSCHDHGSRVTASIGSVKIVSEGEEIGKELQCTAESSKVIGLPLPPCSSPSLSNKGIIKAQKYVSLQTLSVPIVDDDSNQLQKKEKEKEKKEKKEKKKKEKKQRRREERGGHSEDPEYLERKRLKKEKKKEKEMQKVLGSFPPPEIVAAPPPPTAVVVAQMTETRPETASSHKIRIKLKPRMTQ